MSPAIREALVSLDHVDLVHMFPRRAILMKCPPQFLRGAYKSAMRLALTEFQESAQGGDETRRTRAWKLFILLPRLLLFRPARGMLIGPIIGQVLRIFEGSLGAAFD